MNIKIHQKLTRYIFVCFVVMVYFLFKNINFSYAAATPSDLSSALTSDEKERIADFSDLKEMVAQVFELSDDRGTDDLSDPIKLMYNLLGRVLEYYNTFVETSPYRFLIGLALISLIANFSLKIYEESSAGADTQIDSNSMTRKYIIFIFALLIIVNLKGIVFFIVGFFRFILKLCINSTNANFMGTPEDINNILNPERVAYEILSANGVIKTDTLLDEVVVRSKEASVRATYMIPWVFSWISKMALLIVIFLNSILLLVHSIFYVVSIGDFFSGIMNSRFIEYTKTIIAFAINESVIILVLYISNMLLNPYLQDLLRDGVTNHGLSFLTLAMIFTGCQFAKVLAIIISSIIAKKIIGVN